MSNITAWEITLKNRFFPLECMAAIITFGETCDMKIPTENSKITDKINQEFFPSNNNESSDPISDIEKLVQEILHYWGIENIKEELWQMLRSAIVCEMANDPDDRNRYLNLYEDLCILVDYARSYHNKTNHSLI